MRWALEPAMRAASSFLSISRRATSCCSGNGRATEVKIDGQDLLIMKESDVMGVIEGKAAVKKAA